MKLRVSATLLPPPVREGADAVAVLATYAGGWAAGGASLVAYGVQRAVGLSPHPSYLFAAGLVFACLALLRTSWQRVAPVIFVITLFGLTVAVAFEEPSVFHPALPVLILCPAFAGFCLSAPWTVALAVAELTAVVALYGAGGGGRAVVATGFSPVRNLTVLVVCIVVAAVLFSAIGRTARRARTLASESAERAWREVQRREEAEARLARSARLEALGRLAGGVAHDFNNLMSAVSSNLESARPALVELGHAEIVERVEAALQAVVRGARLTRQLLSYSKKQTVRVQAVDVAALVDSMLPLVRRAAGEQNTVLVRMEPDLPPARSDPG